MPYIKKLIMKLFDLRENGEDYKGLIIPSDIYTKLTTIRDKYPEKDLRYFRSILLKDNKVSYPEVKLQDFIQPMYSHKKWLEERNLTLDYYIKTNIANGNKFTLAELVDALRFEIYRRYITRKQYVTDGQLYGTEENWAPTIDSWYLQMMDCENSSLELQCLFIAAGLDGPLEFLTWNVCGKCSLGGHSTIHSKSLVNDKWYHFETTLTNTTAKTMYELPEKGDINNKADITTVWWSFGSQMSRSNLPDGVVSLKGENNG